MAGIIEKLAPSTDLAGVEVSTKSNTTPGFEACLASQSLAGDGPDQEGPLLHFRRNLDNRLTAVLST